MEVDGGGNVDSRECGEWKRPPSRQKSPFPTHLIEFDKFYTVPLTSSPSLNELSQAQPNIAFGGQSGNAVEAASVAASVPLDPDGSVDESMLALALARRILDVPTQRPPSRHKPPNQSLFLDAPRHGSLAVVSTSIAAGGGGEAGSTKLRARRNVQTARGGSRLRLGDGMAYTVDVKEQELKDDGFGPLDSSSSAPFKIEVTDGPDVALRPHTVGAVERLRLEVDSVEPAAAKEHPPFHHHLDGVGAWGLLDDTTIEGGGNNSRADFSGEHGST